jgi:hypothetical protein
MEILAYDNLIAGDIDIATEPITIGESQTIKRGDLLERKVTNTIVVSGAVGTQTLTTAPYYIRPTAAADHFSHYAIASEDVTTGAGETAVTIGYKSGQFNSNAVRFGGASTAADNRDILADKMIYLVEAKKQ